MCFKDLLKVENLWLSVIPIVIAKVLKTGCNLDRETPLQSGSDKVDLLPICVERILQFVFPLQDLASLESSNMVRDSIADSWSEIAVFSGTSVLAIECFSNSFDVLNRADCVALLFLDSDSLLHNSVETLRAILTASRTESVTAPRKDVYAALTSLCLRFGLPVDAGAAAKPSLVSLILDSLATMQTNEFV